MRKETENIIKQTGLTFLSRSTKLNNPFETKGKWYKANLHTHTINSDGEESVEERVRQYYKHGYSVLAITDHNKTNDISRFHLKNFLVINGIETHPSCPKGGDSYHLICLNVPCDIKFPKNSIANTRIKLVKKLGGEVILGHPYWCGHNINHLLAVRGYMAIEVYNATCTKIGKGISSVHWDNLLDSGKIIPAIACDDTHKGRDIFMGWSMIKAPKLTIENIMYALKRGCYYASCGPVIKDFRIKRKKVFLSCSPVVEIHFICQRSNGYSLYAKRGEKITKAIFPLRKNLKYVRCEIVDKKGRRAWTNPIFIKKFR